MFGKAVHVLWDSFLIFQRGNLRESSQPVTEKLGLLLVFFNYLFFFFFKVTWNNLKFCVRTMCVSILVKLQIGIQLLDWVRIRSQFERLYISCHVLFLRVRVFICTWNCSTLAFKAWSAIFLCTPPHAFVPASESYPLGTRAFSTTFCRGVQPFFRSRIAYMTVFNFPGGDRYWF